MLEDTTTRPHTHWQMRRHLFLPAVLAALSGIAPACGRTPPGDADTAAAGPDTAAVRDTAAADTVAGIVAEVGSIPVTSIVVRPVNGGPVTLRGALAREIGRAAGAEVRVIGRRTAEGLDAREYLVRTVDGEPALDGILAAEGNALVLVTPTGRIPVPRPPAALRGMIGARVWLVGVPGGSVTSYGVLRAADRARGRT